MLNNKLTLLLIVVLGLVFGYYYYTNTTPEIVVAPVVGANDNLNSLASISLDVSSLKKERLDALKIFGEYPVSPGATGKRNLFAPI